MEPIFCRFCANKMTFIFQVTFVCLLHLLTYMAIRSASVLTSIACYGVQKAKSLSQNCQLFGLMGKSIAHLFKADLHARGKLVITCLINIAPYWDYKIDS